METFRIFKEGNKVIVDECYLTDEVGINAQATPTATVMSEPKDNEELVCIIYSNGIMDYVPQNILVVDNKELYQNQISLIEEI